MDGGWREMKLGEITTWASGGTPRKDNSEYWNGKIPWISASSMKNTRLFDSDLKISESGLKNGSRLAQEDTILLLIRGSELHKRIPVGITKRSVAFNQDVKAIKPRENIFPEYLLYWFLANEPMLLSKVEHTGIGAGKLDTDVLRNLPFQLPPLSTQRAIAHILGTLDDKIELNRKMNETLEAMARALFKSWFVDFDPVRAKAEGRDPGLPKDIASLFPDRFQDSELGEIPKGWGVKTIGDLTDVLGGSTPSTTEPRYWDGGKHHWATPKDLSGLQVPVLMSTERRITDAGLSQIGSGLLPKGTVLLSSRAPIGYLAVAEVPVAINQGFIAMKPKKGVSNLFLLLWASVAHEEITSRANGSTFLEISKSNFRPIPVVAPAGEVMQAFEQTVRPLYERIVELAHETRNLTDLRDALLPRLISGELRIMNVEQFIEGIV